jgi:hypothetical protein
MSATHYAKKDIMVFSRLAFALCVALVLGIPTASLSDTGLVGAWVGNYECNGQTATLKIKAAGPEGIFEFAYPDGTSGSFLVGIDVDDASGRVRVAPKSWIDRPKNFRMIGLNGDLSADGKTISGRSTGGCGAFTISNPLAKPRTVGAGVKATPETAAPDEPKSSRGQARDKSGDPPIPSAWAADLGCHGLKDIKITFQQPDSAGWDVLIEVLEAKAVQPTLLRARTSPGRHDFGLTIEAEKSPQGRLNRRPLIVSVMPMTHPDLLMVNIRSPNCGKARLRPFLGTDAPQDSTLPPELAALVGAWDGIAYEKKSDDAIAVALVVRPSAAGVKGRYLDADLYLDGRLQPSALMGQGERIGLLPLQPTSRTYEAGISSRLRDGGAAGALITGVLLNRQPMSMFLWRRPDGQTKSLRDQCNDVLGPWFARGKESVGASRTIRQEFYPALSGYDWEEATAREARASANGIEVSMPFASFVMQCSLATADLASLPGSGFLDGAISSDEMIKRRRAMADLGSLDGARIPSEQSETADPGRDMEIAEADLARGVAALPSQPSVAELLAAVDALAPLVSASRPTRALAILAPVISDLERLDGKTFETADLALETFARERMAGLPLPAATLPHRVDLLSAIATGQRTTFLKDEIGFLGGMMARSNEKCGVPTGATLLALSSFVVQGTVLGLGTEFGNPDLGKGLQSQFSGAATFAEGAAFADTLSCADPWLSAFFDILARAGSERYQVTGARAPLFERSCSLAFSGASCACLHRALEPLQPGIGARLYNRSMLESVANASPVISAQILGTCRVNNY